MYCIAVHQAITGYPDTIHPFYKNRFDDINQDIIHGVRGSYETYAILHFSVCGISVPGYVDTGRECRYSGVRIPVGSTPR